MPWPGILTDITRTWSWVADPQSPGARLRILAQGPLPTAGAWVGLGGRRRQGWGWPLGFGVDMGLVGTGREAAIHSWAWLLWDAPLFQGPSEVVGGPCEERRAHHRPPEGLQGQRAGPEAERRSRGAHCRAQHQGDPLTGAGRAWGFLCVPAAGLGVSRRGRRLGLLGLRVPIFGMGPQQLRWAGFLRGGTRGLGLASRGPRASPGARWGRSSLVRVGGGGALRAGP